MKQHNIFAGASSDLFAAARKNLFAGVNRDLFAGASRPLPSIRHSEELARKLASGQLNLNAHA